MRTRLTTVLPKNGTCAVCDEKHTCSNYDKDLKGLVCRGCVDCVVVAEKALLYAGIVQPVIE